MTPWDNTGRAERLNTRTGWERQDAARRTLRLHNSVCHVCGKPGADQVDHVIPLAEGGTDTDDNRRPIHAEPCHRNKTADESRRGRKTRKRPPERHPGLLW